MIDLVKKYWYLFVGIYALGIGTGYGLFHKPPQPQVSLKQDAGKKEDKQEAKTEQINKSKEKTVTEKFAPRCNPDISRPIGCPDCGQQVIERITVEEDPSTITTTESSVDHTTEFSHLDLTIKPQRSRLQLQAGYEQVFDSERQFRVAGRFRLGDTPLWLEVSHIPSNGVIKGFGAAAAVEF